MDKLRVITLVLGEIGTNTYLVYNKDTRACVILDPADDAPSITAKIRAEGLRPEMVLLTHGHSDHFMAADGVRNEFRIPVAALDREEKTLLDPDLNTSEVVLGIRAAVRADRFFTDGEKLSLLGTAWQVIATPGHTAGGCCYYIPAEHMLFSGETLFFESFGRTDFPGGSEGALFRSVTEKLFTLPEETVVYPGHMESTDIGHEKKYNPLSYYERDNDR